MRKIEERDLTCPDLYSAYDAAARGAMGRLGGMPDKVYDTGDHHNHVVSNGTGFCEEECPNAKCPKRVKVTFTAPEITVFDFDRNPIRAFDPIEAKETIQVNGAPCFLGEQRR